LRIEITLFPNNAGGVRFLVQETETRRVLKQGELRGEEELSASAIALSFAELSSADQESLFEVIKRVADTWYPEKFFPKPT
jgi:hypothetical protein